MIYRKKPEEVEALQFDGGNQLQLVEFTQAENWNNWDDGFFQLDLTKGDLFLLPSDYVVKNESGEFLRIKEDAFHKTYELK